MVGHTGKYEAAVKAATATDEAIGMVLDACTKHNYVLLVTADHGNCERMIVSSRICLSCSNFLVKSSYLLIYPIIFLSNFKFISIFNRTKKAVR